MSGLPLSGTLRSAMPLPASGGPSPDPWHVYGDDPSGDLSRPSLLRCSRDASRPARTRASDPTLSSWPELALIWCIHDFCRAVCWIGSPALSRGPALGETPAEALVYRHRRCHGDVLGQGSGTPPLRSGSLDFRARRLSG